MHCKDFLKFSAMKVAKRYMKFILVIFAQKLLLRVNGLLWAQKCCVLRTLGFFIILHNERDEEAHEN